MAEALGIVAGIVQLVDISGRIILASSQLYRNLKNVPDEIETLKRTTQQFIGLLQLITLDLNLSSSPPPETIGNVHVTTILDDAIAEATELADLLERLSSAQKNAVKRAWVTIVSMKKQSAIMEKSRRIESLKCSLQLWYQQYTASKLGDQMYISYFHIRALVTYAYDLRSQVAASQLLLQSTLASLSEQVCPLDFCARDQLTCL